MATTVMTSQLCPELATPPGIVLTSDNIASLNLSTYNRSHGVTVKISCLASPDYVLVGPDSLTCQSNSQWDKAIPTCEFNLGGTQGAEDISMLPGLVIAGAFGVIMLALIAIMLYVNCCWKRDGLFRRRSTSHSGPVGLLASMEYDAERRHRFASAPSVSGSSDVIDSVSHVNHAYSTERLHRDSPSFRHSPHQTHTYPHRHPPPTPLITSYKNVGTPESPRSPTSTYYTARSQGREPPLMTRVGTRQSYRTWHELFYSPDPSLH